MRCAFPGSWDSCGVGSGTFFDCSPSVTAYPPFYASRICNIHDWPLASDGRSYIAAFRPQWLQLAV